MDIKIMQVRKEAPLIYCLPNCVQFMGNVYKAVLCSLKKYPVMPGTNIVTVIMAEFRSTWPLQFLHFICSFHIPV